MDEDVNNTGAYASLVARDGISRVEDRAWKLAAKDGKPHSWRDYLDAAKAELIAEFEADQVDIAEVLRAIASITTIASTPNIN